MLIDFDLTWAIFSHRFFTHFSTKFFCNHLHAIANS